MPSYSHRRKQPREGWSHSVDLGGVDSGREQERSARLPVFTTDRCRSAGVETLSPNCSSWLLLGSQPHFGVSMRGFQVEPFKAPFTILVCYSTELPGLDFPHHLRSVDSMKGALPGVPAPMLGCTLTSDTRWHSRANLAPIRGPGQARQHTYAGMGCLPRSPFRPVTG
jgi:hypothetical protein